MILQRTYFSSSVSFSLLDSDDDSPNPLLHRCKKRKKDTNSTKKLHLYSYYVVQLPFGGTRGSGYGKFAGIEGLRSVCNAKSVCMDKWPSLVTTAIPANLDYPMRKNAWHVSRGVVEVGYGESWGRRWMGARKLVGF